MKHEEPAARSIGALVPWAAELLVTSGIEDARFEAEYLLSYVLDRDRSFLFAHREETPSSDQIRLFRQVLERRCAGEPCAYITGAREFWSLELEVSPSVLIPRPDTEAIVEAVLALPFGESCRVIDLGTGSGAIALAIALERPAWEVYASDKSINAAMQARNNSDRLKKVVGEGRVRLHVGSWLDAIADRSFDIIVANPPYIAEGDPDLDPSTRCEPAEALFSNEDGLADLRLLIEAAPRCLTHGGWLVLEHGAKQHDAVASLASGFYEELRKITDLAGRDRGIALRVG